MTATTIDYETPPATPSRLRKFLTGETARGFWALGDQGIVSIGNFATNIILARNLRAEGAYGAYGICLESILFLNSLQTALIVYPLQLKGAKLDTHGLRRLASGSLILTLICAVPLTIVMAITGGAITKSLEIGLLAAAAVAMWQIQEMLRRALMSQLRYGEVVWGDAVSYIGQAVMLIVVAHVKGELTLPIAFGAIAITSAAAGIIQAIQLGLEKFKLSELPSLAAEFWVQGRWTLAACLATLVTANSFSWVMGAGWGLIEVAKFQVVVAALKLSNPLIVSISGLVTPVVSKAHHDHDANFATKKAMRYIVMGLLALLPYYGAMVIFPQQMIALFFGSHSPYAQDYKIVLGLRIFILNYLAIYIATSLGAILNGLSQPKYGFYSQAIIIGVTVVIALPMVWWLGMLGAVIGGLACVIVWAIANIIFLARVVRNDRKPLSHGFHVVQ